MSVTQFDRMERRLDEIAASLEELLALLRGRPAEAALWAASRNPAVSWGLPAPVPLRKLGERVVVPLKRDE